MKQLIGWVEYHIETDVKNKIQTKWEGVPGVITDVCHEIGRGSSGHCATVDHVCPTVVVCKYYHTVSSPSITKLLHHSGGYWETIYFKNCSWRMKDCEVH